jgi:phosphoribosylaminoimidazole-succinocarboxamide synthase
MTQALFESTIKSLPLLGRGKVRDIYAVDDDKLLIVTSDRLSAFDVVLPDPIPGKGKVLTQLANFWFDKLSAHILPNQLTGIDPESVVAAGRTRPGARSRPRRQAPEAAADRSRRARLPDRLRLEGLPGDRRRLRHQAAGRTCSSPPSCRNRSSPRRPRPNRAITTRTSLSNRRRSTAARRSPASSPGTGKNGAQIATEARDAALALYTTAADYALTRNIIIADTKFEFGVDSTAAPGAWSATCTA